MALTNVSVEASDYCLWGFHSNLEGVMTDWLGNVHFGLNFVPLFSWMKIVIVGLVIALAFFVNWLVDSSWTFSWNG